ncbi:MAG: hypothetical protein ACRC33_05930 [Gemmataceae bacterium]
MTRSLVIVPGLVALLALASGCGPGTGTAAGKVTYQGKPVVYGSVTLHAADGSMHQIGLNTDGTYRLDRVPVGVAKVGVSSPNPAPSARSRGGDGDSRVPAGPPPPPPGAWFPLPAQYAEPAKSGVTLQVGSGTGDIDLK